MIIRFYKRTKDCEIAARVYETPFDDKEKAIAWAYNKLIKIVPYPKKWRVDKGFINKQIKEK